MGRESIQRRFWNPVYDRLAPLYDAVDWFTGNTTHRLRRRALSYLPLVGSRVLEIGFGSGRLHLELAEAYDLAGLDRQIDPSQGGNFARAHAVHAGQFLRADDGLYWRGIHT